MKKTNICWLLLMPVFMMVFDLTASGERPTRKRSRQELLEELASSDLRQMRKSLELAKNHERKHEGEFALKVAERSTASHWDILYSRYGREVSTDQHQELYRELIKIKARNSDPLEGYKPSLSRIDKQTRSVVEPLRKKGKGIISEK